jgi:hypothetical protein
VNTVSTSVAEAHHFNAAPAPDENSYAAPAPAPYLLFSRSKTLKGIKVKIWSAIPFFFLFCVTKIVINMHRKSQKII